MKRIILVLFLLVSFFISKAQYPATGLKQKFVQGIALGSKDSAAFGANDSLVLTIDRNGKLMWRPNGTNAPFKVVSDVETAGTVKSIATNNGTGINGGTITTSGTLSIDTTNISTRLFRIKGTDSLGALIALRVKISDTANMLSTYQRILANYSTTYAISNDVKDSIQTKLAIRDTSGMLSVYTRVQRFQDSLIAVQGRIQTKLALSDTAAMLSPYARTSNLPSLIPYKLVADTFFVNGYTTRGRTKQQIDSLAALIPLSSNFVPYNGAVSNVFLGSNRIKADAFDLGIPSISADSIGRMRWNADDLTMNIGLTSSVVLQSGQEMLILVKNQTGVTIPNGTVVRQSGVVGASGRLKVEPFLANGTHNSNQVLGLTTEDIPNGGDGFVSYFGKVRGLNTAAYPDSTILYASPTVAGGLTNVVPEAPNNIVKIGTVVKSASSNGIIFTRVVAGSNINQDEGVELTNPLNNSLLVYDSLTTLWKDKTLVEIGAVRVQDTAAMLNPYLRKSDTAAMLSPFVQYSDTANMLSPYRRTSTLIQQSEVSGLSTSLAAKLNISDTATMLSPYRRTSTKITNSDLVNSTISGVALGSNLNNLSAGNGLSGTAYNGSAAQTWQVDTSTISTKANVTGLLVGYATTGSVAAKLNISDTASMLSNYRRKTTLIENADLRNSAITINGNSTALGGSISVGTVTSVAASAGTGISISGSPITSNGTLTITNTAPDQTVTLTAGTGISVSGTYPNFTVTNSSPSSGGTVTSVSAGTGMSFTTITSSGAVNADTTVLATRAYAAGLDVAKANTSLNNVNGVLSSTYGGAGSVSGILKANGSGVVSAAVNNSDYTLLNGTGFVRMSGTTPSYITGTSSQFVKADGSLDGTSYATAASLSGYLPLTAGSGNTITGTLYINSSLLNSNSTYLDIYNNTADGSDTKITRIGGGGDVTNNRGANIDLRGNEASGAGNLYLNAGGSGTIIANALINGTSLSMSGGANLATSSGNVGIGTTSPSYKLHVQGTSYFFDQSIFGDKVGIGTTSPANPLTVNNTTSVKLLLTGGSNQNGITLDAVNLAAQYYIGAGINLLTGGGTAADRGFMTGYNVSTGTGAMLFDGNGDIRFGTTPSTERMRITSGGDVLINTTTTDGTNKLIVNGGVKASGNITSEKTSGDAIIQAKNGTVIVYGAVANTTGEISGVAGTETNHPYIIRTFNTERFRISSTGAATFSSSVTATGFFESSSKKLKDIFWQSKQEDNIDFIGFTWKKSLNLDTKKHLGIIAEQVEKVLPDAVNTNDKGVKSVNYNEVLIYKLERLTKKVAELEQKLERYSKKAKK